MLVSIVIPCYNSEKSITTVVDMTRQVFATELPDYDCEFILVDDCSPNDDTFGTIKRLAEERPYVHGATLMRNFGQHNAIMCGLNLAKGDFCMGMDDDLQTHPSQIPAIVHKMEEGKWDVVYGVYRESSNGLAKNFSSWLNTWTARKLLGREKGVQTSNFWMMTKGIRDEMVKYTNYNPYLQALIGRMTNRIGNVEIEHHARMQGSSNYTLGKLAKLWLSYFNYTVVPLRLVSMMGVAMAMVGFIAALATIIYKLIAPSVLMGWASTICVMLICFGFVLLALGIIGEYLGGLVLSANSSPQFIVRTTTDQLAAEKAAAERAGVFAKPEVAGAAIEAVPATIAAASAETAAATAGAQVEAAVVEIATVGVASATQAPAASAAAEVADSTARAAAQAPAASAAMAAAVAGSEACQK